EMGADDGLILGVLQANALIGLVQRGLLPPAHEDFDVAADGGLVNAETGRHLFLRHLGQDHWRKPNKPLFTGGPIIDAGTLACHLCAIGMRLERSVGQWSPSWTGRRNQSLGRGS